MWQKVSTGYFFCLAHLNSVTQAAEVGDLGAAFVSLGSSSSTMLA